MKAPVESLFSLFERLSLRERRLLALFAALVSATALYALVLEPVTSGRGSTQSKIATLKRDMAAMTTLAARIEDLQRRLGKDEPAGGSDASLFALVDRLSSATVTPGSVEAIVPNKGPGRKGAKPSSVDLRLGGVSLAELVQLLARIEAEGGSVHVLHLDLKRRYGDHSLFDASLTVAANAEGT